MRLMSTFLLTIILAATVGAQMGFDEGVDLGGFKSDGCTLWPDKGFADCCIEHDKAYFIGGSRKDRRLADDRLYRCVLSKNRERNKRDAQLMWLGVRIGGLGWLPTPFRWGYGRSYWQVNGEWARKSVEGKRQANK